MKAGERIGHYEILAPIGRGGMGEVFRARDTKLKREVAIKILPPELAREPDRVARLEREATLLAALNHPNIAAIHGLEEHAGGRFLVLELVEGDTLADRLRRGPLAVREAIEISLQLATALEAAHEKGVVHRDLKPANIMITPEGRVKVLDFGLARTLVPAVGDIAGQTAIRTELGVVMGTAPYMSPEQARGASAGRQTDIWSFGAVLYEMLTGASPFERDTGAETLARVLEAQPDYAVLPAAVPANVQRLIRRCLEKDVRRRFRDMGDVCIELEEGRASQLSDEMAPKMQSRAAAFLTPALMMLAIGLGVVAWTFGRPSAVPFAPVVRFEVTTPPTDDATSFALSPDGRHLVFVADSPDGQDAQLWLRSLDQLSIRALPGTEGATFPFWKADSQQIGFFGGGRLKRIELDGGVVQDITEVLAARGGTWNATDDIVYATANTDDLHRASASGGRSSCRTGDTSSSIAISRVRTCRARTWGSSPAPIPFASASRKVAARSCRPRIFC
jgi:serine/threonine protein kinase